MYLSATTETIHVNLTAVPPTQLSLFSTTRRRFGATPHEQCYVTVATASRETLPLVLPSFFSSEFVLQSR